MKRRKLNSLKAALLLGICALSLNGCATRQTVISPECPQPVQIPASISKSDTPAVSAYSKKAEAYQSVKEGGSLSVRGADLASEGAGLLGEVAAKKDAVVKIHSAQ